MTKGFIFVYCSKDNHPLVFLSDIGLSEYGMVLKRFILNYNSKYNQYRYRIVKKYARNPPSIFKKIISLGNANDVLLNLMPEKFKENTIVEYQSLIYEKYPNFDVNNFLYHDLIGLSVGELLGYNGCMIEKEMEKRNDEFHLSRSYDIYKDIRIPGATWIKIIYNSIEKEFTGDRLPIKMLNISHCLYTDIRIKSDGDTMYYDAIYISNYLRKFFCFFHSFDDMVLYDNGILEFFTKENIIKERNDLLDFFELCPIETYGTDD